jgi:hypothetical protein
MDVTWSGRRVAEPGLVIKQCLTINWCRMHHYTQGSKTWLKKPSMPKSLENEVAYMVIKAHFLFCNCLGFTQKSPPPPNSPK